MRIVGVRVSPPFVRLLAQMLEDRGYEATATTITDAIALQVFEPALTLEDHDAMLAVLGDNCPTGLGPLRRQLLDEHALRRRLGR
jgi:hypothetical protein